MYLLWTKIQKNDLPKVGIIDGVIHAHTSWLLPIGRRIKVHLNEFDQLTRIIYLTFMHFLSNKAKDGHYCPIGEVSCRHLFDHYKSQIVDKVRVYSKSFYFILLWAKLYFLMYVTWCVQLNSYTSFLLQNEIGKVCFTLCEDIDEKYFVMKKWKHNRYEFHRD